MRIPTPLGLPGETTRGDEPATEAATPPDASRVRNVFRKVLKHTRLLVHFTPHCLRHTFASLLLREAESPAYVQRQLGYTSIQLTVDTYGKWLPMGNKAAVNQLEDQNGGSGSKSSDGHPGGLRSARQCWWAVKDSNLGPAELALLRASFTTRTSSPDTGTVDVTLLSALDHSRSHKGGARRAGVHLTTQQGAVRKSLPDHANHSRDSP
jgi:hypothetical protein